MIFNIFYLLFKINKMKDLYLISTKTLQYPSDLDRTEHEDWEPDPEKRWKHILENQIFMVEIQKESCEIIERLFNPYGKYKLNLYNQSLKII